LFNVYFSYSTVAAYMTNKVVCIYYYYKGTDQSDAVVNTL